MNNFIILKTSTDIDQKFRRAQFFSENHALIYVQNYLKFHFRYKVFSEAKLIEKMNTNEVGFPKHYKLYLLMWIQQHLSQYILPQKIPYDMVGKYQVTPQRVSNVIMQFSLENQVHMNSFITLYQLVNNSIDENTTILFTNFWTFVLMQPAF